MISRLALVLASVCAASAAPAQVADVRQGTNIAIALSPVDDTLAVDLLGGLWRLPATGGGAVELVPAGEGLRNPRFSPDGGRIVVQRWLDGQWDLWLYETTSGAWEALTATPADEVEPDFTPDGRAVIFASNRTGRFTLWRLALAGGATPTQLTDEPGDSSFPSVSGQGDVVYVHRDAAGTSLELLGASGTGTEIYRSDHLLGAPSWRPGGSVVVFNELEELGSSVLKMLVLADEPVVKALTRSEDVFLGRVAWPSRAEILYTADGQIWRRGLGEPGRKPVHLFAGVSVALGAPHRVERALDAPGPYPVAGVVRPETTADGAVTTFAALGDIWASRRRGLERLTDDAFLDTDPDPSADGRAVVFVSDRGGSMDLWRRDLDNGVTSQLTAETAKPFLPTFDPSGEVVAYLETDGFGPWAESRLMTVRVAAPYRSATIATELYDARALTWAPEGGAVLVEARRYSRENRRAELRFPIEGTGTAPGPRREGPRPQLPDDAALRWTARAAEAPYVVEVGRLFDGVRNDYLRHMDIHVSGQRITAVVRRGTLPLPERVVDLRDATIIPGLIDVHAHHSALAGERLGRLWLAYGVTTVREIGEDLTGALERAESWASGRRLGPRLVVSPTRPIPAVVESRLASAPVVVDAYEDIDAGLTAAVVRQRERLGIPEVGSLAALRVLDPYAERRGALRVSAQNMSYQDSLATVLASGTTISTGLAAAAGAPVVPPSGRARAAAAGPLTALTTPEERARWSGRRARATPPVGPLEDTIGRLVRSGGRVAVGSDAPAVPYGYGLHAELGRLADAGIPNDQVLRLASASGAIALGLDRQLGTIEAGKLADFVVVDGDPLARLADAAAVVAVVKGGVWIDRDTLLDGPPH